MAKRAIPASRLRARRRKRRVILFIVLLVVLCVFVGALIGLAWLPFVRVQTISVSGASSISQENIKNTVHDTLAGRIYQVLPKDNVFLYSDHEIESSLTHAYPSIEQVRVRRTSLQALFVAVTERQGAALWCGTSPASSSPCFLLDNSGVAYAPAADFSGQIYLKYFGVLATTTLGTQVKQFLGPASFSALSATVAAVVAALPQENPSRVIVVGGDVSLNFKSGFELRFELRENSADTVDRLKIALGAQPFVQHQLSEFEYLDLRFGDKLYYKLRE
jgi:cell division septal protein FtsQ